MFFFSVYDIFTQFYFKDMGRDLFYVIYSTPREKIRINQFISLNWGGEGTLDIASTPRGKG